MIKPKRGAYVRARIKEPSTAAGVAAIAAAVAPMLPGQYQALGPLVAALAGAWAIFKRDPGSKE